jgi:hypothetical protein
MAALQPFLLNHMTYFVLNETNNMCPADGQRIMCIE